MTKRSASPLAVSLSALDLRDRDVQREIYLGNFERLDRLFPLIGRPETDQQLARCLVEFSQLDRMAYIRANDMVDRVIGQHPEYLATFQRYLESRISEQCAVPTVPDDDWARGTAVQHHHLFDLWADCIRRKLLKRVHYDHDVWKPTVMCVEITQECNAYCGHCASNSSPRTKIRLEPDKVRDIVVQAAHAGIEFLGITGGEPFLEMASVIEAIRTATANGIRFDYINSNCFWARTEEKAVATLQAIKAVADKSYIKRRRGMFSLSVTTEHLKWVPIQNFVNVIRAHEKVFPGQTLEMVSIRGEMFGERQEDALLRVIAPLGDHVTRIERDEEGRIARIYTKLSEIDVFFNYIVPIGRGEDMRYEEYEHFQLSDKELSRGLSALHIDGNVVQTVTVGWDGKCAPDVVLKCSESVIAGNLHLEPFVDVLRRGNNDPLIRGILTSVRRLIHISRRSGIFDLMQAKLRFHSSIQGYVSEFMKDPKKRLLMTIDLMREDVDDGLAVFDGVGVPIRDVDAFVDELVETGDARMVSALRHLIRTFVYRFDFSGTTIQSHVLAAVEGDKRACC